MDNNEVVMEDNPTAEKQRFDVLGLVGMILAILGTVSSDILFTVAGLVIAIIIIKKQPDKMKRSIFAKVAFWVGIGGTAFCIIAYVIALITGLLGLITSFITMVIELISLGRSLTEAINNASATFGSVNNTATENNDIIRYIIEILLQIFGQSGSL